MAGDLIETKIEVTKLVRSKRRSVSLQITDDGSLIVRAPKSESLKFIARVIQDKRQWILQKQQLAKERYQTFAVKQFISGETFYYLGNPYPLCIVATGTASLYFKEGFYLTETYISHARKLFHAWYWQQAQQQISERVSYYAQQAGLSYKKVRISNTRAQWASCSADGNLSFCWRLILAPLPVVDYVVAHELAHLTWRSHSQRFWQKVKKIYPDFESHRKWLATNSHLLNFL